MLTEKRIQAALKSTQTHNLMALSHPGHDGLTLDMLAGELQRIEQLLTGKPYYDYTAQTWITD